MIKQLTILSVATLLAAFTVPAHAEKLVIDNAQMAEQSSKPRHGQQMDSVRSEFGEPTQVIPAVGEPPITRWIYAGYVVYFEGDRVIHAVSK